MPYGDAYCPETLPLTIELIVMSGVGLTFNGMALARWMRGETIPEWLKTDLALAGITTCLYLMDGLPWVTWERFGVWLLCGLVLYFVYGYHHSALNRRRDPATSAPR